jgi:serine/threonine-protein phosphatase 6 regulatory ankyrin repeat subunit B
MSKELQEEYNDLSRQVTQINSTLSILQNQRVGLQNQLASAQQLTSLDNQITSATATRNQLQQQINILNAQLNARSSETQTVENNLSQLQAEQKILTEKKQIEERIYYELLVTLNRYRELKAEKLTPSVVNILPPEELAKSKVLVDLTVSKCENEFDKALAKLTNIDFQDLEGKTTLMHALLNSFHYGVGKLLASGADVNLLDNKGANALIYGAHVPHIKYVKLVADKTTNLNHQAAGLQKNAAIHFLVSNVRKVIFTSELSELDCPTNGNFTYFDLAYFESEVIADHECTLTIDTTPERADLYTINQNKALKILDYLINKGANINLQNEQGLTPFAISCAHRLKYAAKKLIDQYPIDFTLKDLQNNTALHFAARSGSTDVAKLVLTKNIDINAQNSGGGTPILQAAYINDKTMVEFLLSRNANIDILDVDGRHPWHYACISGALDIIKFLYDKIPNIIDLRTEGNDQCTGLSLASQQGRTELVQWLAAHGANIDLPSNAGTTPLHEAIGQSNLSMVKTLINLGANVNKTDNNGINSLGATIARDVPPSQIGDTISIIELLMQKYGNNNGAQNTQNINGKTPFFLACGRKYKLLAKKLLSYSPNLTIVDKDGNTALHWAVHLQEISVVQSILDKNILSIDVRNNAGGTPILWAAYRNDKAMVEYLLNHNADLNILDKDGMHPWHYTCLSGALEAAKFLVTVVPNIIDLKIANNAQCNGLWVASAQGHSGFVQWLVQHGADVNTTRQSDGLTALQAAISNKKFDTVQTLIDYNADVNKSDQKQFTPLYHAVQLQDLQIIQLLLQHNANVSSACHSGDQPIHMAGAVCNILIIKMLLDHGATVNSTSNSGDTPLHEVLSEENKHFFKEDAVAISKKKIDAVKYLLAHSAKTDVVNNKGETPIDLARAHFQEALPWLEHPENLPPLDQLEASLMGNL